MAPFCHLLILFPDLNDSLIKITDTSPFELRQSVPVPVLNFSTMLIDQTLATQSNVDANHFTVKSCVETVTTVSNLSHRLQNKTSEATSVALFRVPSYSSFDGQRGIISFRNSVNAEAESSKASQLPFRVFNPGSPFQAFSLASLSRIVFCSLSMLIGYEISRSSKSIGMTVLPD
ncbi:hypothetical protein ACSBR2_026383 [Camellia fascicularis]